MVRRAALVLSLDRPALDLYGQLAALLSDILHASSVEIVAGNAEGLRAEYVFRNGQGNGPANDLGTPDQAAMQILTDGETRFEPAAIVVPIPFGGRVVGALSVRSHEPDAFTQDDVPALESVAVYLGARFHVEQQRAVAESLKQNASTDALTGLANRRAFDETLLREWRRCMRSGASLGLAMIDVDYFKRFNDSYGHVAGDVCLHKIAQALAISVKRPADFSARYGGEEFAIILPDTDIAGAVHVLEEACEAVRALSVPHKGVSLEHVTMSVGIATSIPHTDDDPQSLIAAADAMLYEAKSRGRNRVAALGYLSDAPPTSPKTIVRQNLPRYLTPIIGREQDAAKVGTLIESYALVSIVGSGGVGKTRMAVDVAETLLEAYDDGVWFVDFAPLSDPALVQGAIAGVFDIPDQAGSRSFVERIGAALKPKKLLLVLDNCEHVIAAAAETVARLVQLCPRIRIVATSREPLGVPGEQVYRMSPLAVPPESEEKSADRLSQYAAVQLFVQRARAAQHSFVLDDQNAEIVAAIVRRLDGIALAIELAAPRVKALGLRRLEQRLDERFQLLTGGSRTLLPRQQTLRALIDWSYHLLAEAERRMLRRTAIFRGGWSLEALESVCVDEGAAPWDAIDLISSLVDKSLVVAEMEDAVQRYRLLESTREFALEQLHQAAESSTLSARHCRYFAEVAQRDGDAYWHTDSDAWIARVRVNLENYRAAIAFGLSDSSMQETAAAIVANLWRYWFVTARREGLSLLQRAAASLTPDAPARVRGLLALAATRLDVGSEQAMTAAADAVRALSAGVDDVARAEALLAQGDAYGRAGRSAESMALLDDALAAARATHLPRLVGAVLTTVAGWKNAAGQRSQAHQLFDEAAEVLERCNDRRRLAAVEGNRSEVLFAEDDFAGALAAAQRAEQVYRQYGEDARLCTAVLNLAAYLLAVGKLDEAFPVAREGLQLALREGVTTWPAIAIGHLAQLAAEAGDVVRAARLLGYTDAVYQKIGTSRLQTEQRGYERTLDVIRSTMPHDRIAALMLNGAALRQDDAVEEAMSIARAGDVLEGTTKRRLAL